MFIIAFSLGLGSLVPENQIFQLGLELSYSMNQLIALLLTLETAT